MIVLTQAEWTIVIICAIIIIGFLYFRSQKKKKRLQTQHKAATKIYKAAIKAQESNIQGITTNTGSILPTNHMDPLTMMAKESFEEMKKRDYMEENEFLLI